MGHQIRFTSFFVLFFTFGPMQNFVSASIGDSTPYYKDCVRTCTRNDCLNDGKNFKISEKETLTNRIVLWRCSDECKYDCMWDTVTKFNDRGWAIPQFHGKWPFTRWLGMQEPASAIFSVLNLVVHVWGLRKIRRTLPRGIPFGFMWQIFSLICINAWIWSTIFHIHDTVTTELFDYSAAYSMVIGAFYCMVARVGLHKRHYWYKVGLAFGLSCFFYRHFIFLALYHNYAYNMKVNIATGTAAGVGWLVWAFGQRQRRPYVKYVSWFVILSALALGLEVADFAPFLDTFDAHSLWHLVTAPVTIFLYQFILHDCRALGKEEDEKDKIP